MSSTSGEPTPGPTPPLRWFQERRSEYPWEQDGLDHVRGLMPGAEPYRAWATFSFTAVASRVNECDLLIVVSGGLYLVELKGYPVFAPVGIAHPHRRPGRLRRAGPDLLVDGLTALEDEISVRRAHDRVHSEAELVLDLFQECGRPVRVYAAVHGCDLGFDKCSHTGDGVEADDDVIAVRMAVQGSRLLDPHQEGHADGR